mgnify:CR=1 FL=1
MKMEEVPEELRPIGLHLLAARRFLQRLALGLFARLAGFLFPAPRDLP